MYIILDSYHWYSNHYGLYFFEREIAKSIKEQICNKISEILKTESNLGKERKLLF